MQCKELSLRLLALTVGILPALTVLCGASVNGGARGAEVSESKHINTLLLDPKTPEILYIATQGAGVFRTNNGGEMWKPMSRGLPGPFHDSSLKAGRVRGNSIHAFNPSQRYAPVYALAMDPLFTRTMYAATQRGMYRTLNGGESWQAINRGLPLGSGPERLPRFFPPVGDPLILHALALDPIKSSMLYLGTNRGTYKSTDSGESWTQIGDRSPYFRTVTAFGIHPLDTSIVYAAAREKLFKSRDGGETWASLYTHLVDSSIITALAIDPAEPNIVYAGTSLGGVLKTSNGRTWSGTRPNHPLDVRALAIDPVTTATLYAGTGGGVFKSKDAAETWTPVSTDAFDVAIQEVAVDPRSPNVVYAGGRGGVFKSTDGGRTWRSANRGLVTHFTRANNVSPFRKP